MKSVLSLRLEERRTTIVGIQGLDTIGSRSDTSRALKHNIFGWISSEGETEKPV